ncbi:MAG: glycosyltransferase family 2 protein [Candidatus Woesearchaeota archaeon]
MKHVWVIIPAYNEGSRIKPVITETKKYCKNIVVVDDGSRDDTVKVAESTGVTVLKHALNLGKGGALKTGCDYAVTNGAEVLIAMDADGQHEPSEIPALLEKLKGKDIVFGYRSLSGQMPFVFRFGNAVINTVIHILYGIKLRDTQCGYRVFTASAYHKIRWQALDYTLESEMIANVGKHRLKYREHRIRTIYADRYKGTTVLDGVKIVLNMIIWRLRK